MSVSSPEDHAFFEKNGYVIVRSAVPRANSTPLLTHLGFPRHGSQNPEDWYREPLRPNGMVEMYQHQALWNNRQHPRIYQAFAEILARTAVGLYRSRLHEAAAAIRRIRSTITKASSIGTRILPNCLCRCHCRECLYLADTDVDQGGFQCVPSLFRQFDAWLKTQPPDRNPHAPDLTGYEIEPIPGKAGDFLIWNRLLAHGNGHNVSKRPRLAQYIAMFEADPDPLHAADWGVIARSASINGSIDCRRMRAGPRATRESGNSSIASRPS